jgi:hypothetical protein
MPQGDGQWKSWRDVSLKADEATQWVEIPATVAGPWIRAKADRDVAKASVTFQYAAQDGRIVERGALFQGLSKAGEATSQGAFLLTRGANLRTLSVLSANVTVDQTTLGDAYELSADLKLTKLADQNVAAYVEKNTPIPQGIITADEASVIFEESGVRWRLPRSASPAQDAPARPQRLTQGTRSMHRTRYAPGPRHLLRTARAQRQGRDPHAPDRDQ